MTQNELYAAAALIAFFSFMIGRGQHTQAMKTETAMPDPLGWLNQYTSV